MMRQQITRLHRSHYFNVFFALVYIFSPLSTTSLKAQVTLSLTYTEKNNLTTIQSGGIYTMQLNYSVSSTTGNASGVQAVINLPDNIREVTSYVGTIHAPTTNFVFTNTLGAKKLTITFVDPLASGSTGVLEFGVVTNNFTTLNNTVLATAAEMTATGGYTSGVQNQTITVTAIPRICAQKVLLGGGALDNETRYRITVSNTNSSTEALGTLQSTNITLLDNLPTGTEFVSAKIYNSSGVFVGNGAESGGVVTMLIPDLTITYYSMNQWQANYYYVDIVVKYNAPTFSVGDVVTNTATVDYTPFSGTAATLVNGQTVGNCTADLIEATTLVAPVISADLVKYGGGDIYPGNTLNYQLGFANTGNVALENVEIIETIPANIRINQAAEANGVRIDVKSQFDRVEYQTNVSGATWVVAVGKVVPVLPTGEYFTKLKYVLNTPFAAGRSLAGYTILFFSPTTEVLADEVVTNCVEWTSTTVGIPGSRTTCNSNFTLKPRPTTSKINYYVRSTSTCSVNIGDIVSYNNIVAADDGYSDALNPVFALLIPAGFSFVPGSEVYSAGTSGIVTAPTLQIVPNYITIGGIVKDMYRWTFPSGTVLPHGKSFSLVVQARATIALTAGVAYSGDFIATASNASINSPEYNYGTITDTNDWDLDGNVTETINRTNTNYYSCNVTVLASASMESIKWVKGQCDTRYTRYPSFGSTVPGGSADYRLVVKNTGNIPMKDIKIVDILPFVGDRGVIDPSARLTQWRPNLASPIIAPTGITVYYSTVSTPCRDEVKQPSDPSPFPTGCATANWTTTPPTDITQVQSVKIDFGATVLQGGDSLVFLWPMRAPVSAPTNDEIAWNSFAFVATRTDNNQPLLAAEPIKVGIKLKPLIPAIFGVYVWIDTNQNGIQDDGLTGISGVRVDLYKDNGDGISNPNTDLFVGFTVTDSEGKYLFSSLQAGDYFAVFSPPVGYLASPSNQGGNAALDSDGLITPVTHIDALEDDRTWNLGIYPSTDCSVRISSTTISPCVWDGTQSNVTANVFVTWANAPSGQNITVTLNGVTQTVNVVGGATSPALVTFTLPANNTDYTVTAVFDGTPTCTTNKVLHTSLPCQPNVCTLNIGAVNVSACNAGNATVDVTVAWSGAPSGENINVVIGGTTQTVNVSGGITSPATVSFTVVANGTTNNPITAAFATTNTCTDNDTYNSPTCPLPCDTTLIVNNATICNGSTVNLFSLASGVKGTLTYSTNGTTWTALTNPTNVTPSVSTTYFVKDTLTGGCVDIDTLVVTVNAQPTMTNVTATSATCTNGSANSNATVAVTGITGMAKYAYRTNATDSLYALTATASTASSINLTGLANPSVPTTYTFRMWGVDTACYNDTTVVLTPSVCPPCSISATLTQGMCNNNGTTITAADDYFTILISGVSATNGGTSGKYEVLLNGSTVLNTGGTNYGSSVTVGTTTTFLSNGSTTYNLTVRGLDQPTCVTTIFTTLVSAGCSVTPCPATLCLPVTVTRN